MQTSFTKTHIASLLLMQPDMPACVPVGGISYSERDGRASQVCLHYSADDRRVLSCISTEDHIAQTCKVLAQLSGSVLTKQFVKVSLTDFSRITTAVCMLNDRPFRRNSTLVRHPTNDYAHTVSLDRRLVSTPATQMMWPHRSSYR
jgi:hypothetical protein